MSNPKSEIRVRAVQRFVVTEYMQSPDGRASSSLLCESGSHAHVVSLADGLAAIRSHEGMDSSVIDMVDADEGNFVIVQAMCYEPETIAYYAQTKKGAKQAKADAEAKHGGEFRIYRAESVQTKE